MKIALVNHSFSLSHGGLERFSVNLATVLHQEGHEVHAFAQRFADLPAGVNEHCLFVPRKPSFRRILGFHHSAARAVQEQAFDVVYGLARFAPLDVYRMGDGVQKHWMRIRYPFAPWRWLNYLINPAHLCNLYLERQILAGGACRRIVTNSRLCKEHAQRYYAVPAERIDVVYNGVNHQLFNPQSMALQRFAARQEIGLGPEALAVLHVSNNWKRKGLDVLLKAIALLGTKGAHLHVIVVGRGRPAPFRKLADRLGLADRLHLVGESKAVQKYYAASDLMVLPTLYDPFSNVCLEAMACGMPVITTSENGAAELIREGENGYVQKNPLDSLELMRCLEKCLDRQVLEVMGRTAWQTSLPFTREKNMQETIGVFSQVIAEKQDRTLQPVSSPTSVVNANLSAAMRDWHQRALTCLGSNEAFVTERLNGFRIFRQRTPQAEAALRYLLPNPDRAFDHARILKPGSRTHAAVVEISGAKYVLKRYNCRGWLYRLGNAFRRSRAVRAWLVNWEYLVRSVPVPMPLLCLEERRCRFLERSYVLMEFVEETVSLRERWRQLAVADTIPLLHFFGRLLGEMHRLGMLHGDLKWDNILVGQRISRENTRLVDLDGSVVVPKFNRLRAQKDLARFLKDLDKEGGGHLQGEITQAWERALE